MSSYEEEVEALRQLVARAGAGDEEAARTLYEDYREAMVRFIRRNFLRARSPLRRDFDSDDFVQATWESLFEEIRAGRRFDSPQQFTRFMQAILRNEFRMASRFRVQAAKRTLRREETPRAPVEPVGPGPDPAETAAIEDEWTQFERCLPARTRAVLRLTRFGWRTTRIAAMLELSERTVRRCRQEAWTQWHHRSGGGGRRRPCARAQLTR